jgi:hypothetical protein
MQSTPHGVPTAEAVVPVQVVVGGRIKEFVQKPSNFSTRLRTSGSIAVSIRLIFHAGYERRQRLDGELLLLVSDFVDVKCPQVQDFPST